MNSIIRIIILVATLISSPLVFGGEIPDLKIYQTTGEFTDVRQDLVDAIIGQDYGIDYNGRPSEMLKRTRKDVGGKPLYLGTIYVSYRKLTSSSNQDSSLLAVENMLYEIAREVVE